MSNNALERSPSNDTLLYKNYPTGNPHHLTYLQDACQAQVFCLHFQFDDDFAPGSIQTFRVYLQKPQTPGTACCL